MTKLSITQEIKEKFQKYKNKNSSWGSLHIVLDDNNIQDSSVLFCKQYAAEQNDYDGELLADILLQMSKTQRLKIGNIIK